MKNDATFKDFYKEEFLNKIELYSKTYYSLLNKEKQKLLIFAVVAGIFVVLAYFFLKVYEVSIAFNALYIIAFGGFIALLYKKMLNATKRQLCLDVNKLLYIDILSFITKDKKVLFNPNSRIAKEHFKSSQLFNLDTYNYNGENFTTCVINDEKIIFSDIFIYNYKYKTLVDYFVEDGKTYKKTTYRKIPQNQYKGLYIEIPLQKDLTSTIYLISNKLKTIVKDKVNGVLTYSGQRVELENIDLEKVYNIYSDDETLARYIFNLTYMENIMEMDKYIKCQKNIVYRTDNKLSVFIENFTIDDLLNEKVKFNGEMISEIYIEQIFNNINNIVKTIELLQTNEK